MTKEQYKTYTEATRRFEAEVPFGAFLLKLPTFLCAGIYLLTLAFLVWNRDLRFWRTAAIPAATFVIVTILRPIINRQRPYDLFDLPPVGEWKRGKGKSMPSRHAASAASISICVSAVFPSVPVILGMTLLCGMIGILRIATGKHFPSDVAAAIALAALLSILGYAL